MSDSTNVTKLSHAELTALVLELQARIVKLEESASNKPKNEAQREMTDDDARRIMTGDLAQTKHKDAAEKLGLSYGQIYSCRGEYTFKHIHKELAKNPDFKNTWKK